MSVLPIVFYGDPVLAQTAEPARFGPDLIRLAEDMIDTMYDAPGRGLAAPQVGVSTRMFVMDCHWKDGADRKPWVVINPELSDPSDDIEPFTEGCLSIPDVPLSIDRPAEVTMKWLGLDETWHWARLKGLEARCAQHEFDHLNGVLITDLATPDQMADYAESLTAIRTQSNGPHA